MSDQMFHHAIRVITSSCKGCTHCMKRCPTQAIRIKHGKAEINGDLCIDCGQCMAVCPNDAIKVEQDPFNQLDDYLVRVAIIPAIFFAQFPDSITLGEILGALYAIGFTHIYLAETGVDILDVLNAEEKAPELPLISNFCPAVQRLIQIRFPLLVDNLSRLRPPAQVTAIFARSELSSISPDLGIFYFTPCAAKIAQFNTEGSEENRLFDGIINIDTAYNLVSTYLAKHDQVQEGSLTFALCTKQALLWSLVKGQIPSHEGRTLAVDEMHNVIEFLEILEEEEQTNLQFLELDACAEGCVGGILTVRNRFLASERLKYYSEQLPEVLDEVLIKRIQEQRKAFQNNLRLPPFKATMAMGLDTDRSRALYKLQKVTDILKVLPGIDCGLCGSPTCKSLAEDIAKGQASLKQCVVLKLRNAQSSSSLSRIWGDHAKGEDVLRDGRE
ncbi:[Fe-Fe] hydrogenase large subunit C-terminal domain-containing protein [uncultured Sphaerochaeta sp.]|uniref:[Fe-Fe] hydrogenase large subunit C-terminal domain-containing protein n=1 Tax=uncultured Sphaerochaeta sp. TaxID=886478 RepID=UPI0029C9ECCA|nr:[Fe-Fe] hydrogenase large subunit C-terminal domain-containing protein [uncultured Sphaerochaeta sp.]